MSRRKGSVSVTQSTLLELPFRQTTSKRLNGALTFEAKLCRANILQQMEAFCKETRVALICLMPELT